MAAELGGRLPPDRKHGFHPAANRGRSPPELCAALASWRQTRAHASTTSSSAAGSHQLAATQSIHDPDSRGGAATGFFFTGGGTGAGVGSGGAAFASGGGRLSGRGRAAGAAVGGRRLAAGGRRLRRGGAAATGGGGGSLRRRRRGRRHAELVLQRAQFGIADVDQTLRFRQLPFQILDAILERLRLGTRCAARRCRCAGAARRRRSASPDANGRWMPRRAPPPLRQASIWRCTSPIASF